MPIVQLLLDYVRRNSNFPAQYTVDPKPKSQVFLVFSFVGEVTRAWGAAPEPQFTELLITPTRTVEEVWDWIQENDYAEERRRRGAGRTPKNLKTVVLPELTMGEAV